MTIHQTAQRVARAVGKFSDQFRVYIRERERAKRDESQSGAFRTEEESQRELRVMCDFVVDCTKVPLAMRY